MKNALEIRGLTRKYEGFALDSVNLTLPRGCVMGLVGENGAGKTTLIKTVFFAYIITSISAFYGYYAKGNSLEVGTASTRAVVACSVVILLFDLILTQVLLI